MNEEELTKHIIAIRESVASLAILPGAVAEVKAEVQKVNGTLRATAQETAKLCQWQVDHEQVHQRIDKELETVQADVEQGKEKTGDLRVQLAKYAVAAGGGAGLVELVKVLITAIQHTT